MPGGKRRRRNFQAIVPRPPNTDPRPFEDRLEHTVKVLKHRKDDAALQFVYDMARIIMQQNEELRQCYAEAEKESEFHDCYDTYNAIDSIH